MDDVPVSQKTPLKNNPIIAFCRCSSHVAEDRMGQVGQSGVYFQVHLELPPRSLDLEPKPEGTVQPDTCKKTSFQILSDGPNPPPSPKKQTMTMMANRSAFFWDDDGEDSVFSASGRQGWPLHRHPER